ncbi:MAG: hypothetical protein ABIJ57_10910 [Pseudomonadota bacterium]
MGGMKDIFFGSDAKQVGTADIMTPEQSELLKSWTSLLSGQAGQGVDRYQGQMVAGAAPGQEQAFDFVQSLMGGAGGSAINRLLQPYDPQADTEYWKNAFVDPAMQEFQDTILPAVQESFIGRNAGRSGAANRAIAGAGEDLMTGLSGQLANLLYGGRQQADTNALNAISGGSALANLGLTAGGVERGIGQEGLSSEQNEWLRTRDYNNPYNNFLSMILNASQFQPITQGPTKGILGDLIGATGDILAAFAG